MSPVHSPQTTGLRPLIRSSGTGIEGTPGCEEDHVAIINGRPPATSHDRVRTGRDLTGEQASRLARLLHAQLVEMHERVASNEELCQSLSHDPSFGSAERRLVEHSTRQAIDVIRATDRSLSAIDDGTYGSCALCGRAIALELLEEAPTARTCGTCSDV